MKLALGILFLLPPLADSPPARGAAEFESSAFCRQYRCVLSGPVEPLRSAGVVREYFYNYRVYLRDGTMHPGQFGMRLTTTGERADPWLIVRWIAVREFGPRELLGIDEFVRELTGSSDFEAAAFVRRCAEGKKAGYGEPTSVGRFRVSCSYTPGAQPQVTLLLERQIMESIGSATMTADGTIILDLRAAGPGGMRGDARLTYPRGHKDYDSILKHLGGLRPGEHKPVPPWPE